MPKKIPAVVLIVIVGIVLLWTPSVLAEKKDYTEEELGIRKEPLYDEKKAMPEHGETIKKEPGESKKFERSFENSPALIPHDITGMLPIAQTNNICMGCHMPDAAVGSGATPIPRSHFVDMDTGKDLEGKLDGDRYNCLHCHVIQTVINPPVKNIFKGEFRDKEGKHRSNLLDVLNEGVKSE